MIRDLQDKIIELKKQQDVCILAHSYQAREILEVADYTGDSFQLSVAASKAPQQRMLMCGVRFMGETVKLLNPQKQVILASPQAGCPMAEQIDPQTVKAFSEKHPDYTVVAYINTTAALKTVCDVCVTSSSAVKIVKGIENDHILFLPDCNLGGYVQSQVPEKHIELMRGGCPVHAQVSVEEVLAAKALHPEAQLLVHPECIPAVTQMADYAGSTSGIMDYAARSEHKAFIIGTEMSIVEHLQYELPHKEFYPLSKKLICANMKLTTLPDVYKALTGTGGEDLQMEPHVMKQARKCIDEMIRLG